MKTLQRLSIVALLSLLTAAFATPASATVVGCLTIDSNNVVTDGKTCVTVEIPAYVTSIGFEAFQGSTTLTAVTFAADSQLNLIGVQAFNHATKLSSITIPEGVTKISSYAFNDTQLLSSITIPESVTVIENDAFGWTIALTEVTIPSNVTTIGSKAFRDASSLATVNFAGNAPVSVASDAFQSIKAGAVAGVCAHATGFSAPSTAWKGLTVTIATCPGLTPSLSTATSTADGFTLQISNFDLNYSWAPSVSSGLADIDPSGLVSVTGVSAGASSTLTITTSRQYYTDVAASVTASALAAPAIVAPVQPAPYSGPLLSDYSTRTPETGDEVVVSGLRLNTITSCTIDGAAVDISNHNADSFTITIPAGLKPGLKNLVITSSAGTLTVQDALTISAAAEDSSESASAVGAKGWTKKLNDSSAKIYAKDVVGAGKVQIFFNGKEIAWVNATSESDSKLRTANGSHYLVRTVDLVQGQKNVLEVYVDGIRIKRVAYSY